MPRTQSKSFASLVPRPSSLVPRFVSCSIYGVVLAGGVGERLWPVSRRLRPKYSLCVGSNKSLLTLAYERLCRAAGRGNVYVATQDLHARLTKELIPGISPEKIISEPLGRNTAAAIGLAAVRIAEENPDAIMAIVPADQYIYDAGLFHKAVMQAVRIAASECGIVTIGIRPTYSSTGYGYIKIGARIRGTRDEGRGTYEVSEFVEKPNPKKAKEFIRKGYLWNSGIFVCKASVMLDEIKKYMPELYGVLTGPKKGFTDKYRRLKKVSIDHGVMQKAKNVYVVKSSMRWDDVGSWASFLRIERLDSGGNMIKAKHKGLDTKGCCIVSHTKRLIATYGVRDLVIVDTDDALLVCGRDKVEKVKDLVGAISGNKRLEKCL